MKVFIYNSFKAVACSFLLISFGFGINISNAQNLSSSSISINNDSASNDYNQSINSFPDNVPHIEGNEITNTTSNNATKYINSMTLSLKAIYNDPQKNKGSSFEVWGTGWIMDKDESTNNLTYYVATNMHVINDMFYQGSSPDFYHYYFGQTGIGDALTNDNNKDSYTAFTAPPKPVFEALNYPKSTNLMVDFGVVEVTFPKPNVATKTFDWLEKNGKLKFEDLQPSDCGTKKITVGGYPSIREGNDNINFWNQYSGDIDHIFKPYNIIEPKTIDNHKYSSGGANYITSHLDLMPGSSGSMVIDSSTFAIVGIYWGIYNVQGEVEGTYSSLINTYSDKNNNIYSYNLINDYRNTMKAQGKETYITKSSVNDLYVSNSIRNTTSAGPLVAIWVLLGLVIAIVILSVILGLIYYEKNKKNII